MRLLLSLLASISLRIPWVLSDQDADEEAESLLQRALTIRLQALGPRHAEVISVQEKLVALQNRRNTNN
jgi:hypothetical protein